MTLSISSLIRAMTDAGAPPEAIIIAVEAIEAVQAEAEEARDEIEIVRAKAREKKRAQRAASRRTASAVPGQGGECPGTVPGHVQDNPSPSPLPNENLNPHPAPTRTRTTPARERTPDLPEGATVEQWDAFREMRRRIRKPMTGRAEQLALGKLAKLAESGEPPGAVLDQSILNGYQDLYPIKDNRSDHKPRPPNRSEPDPQGRGRTRIAADRVLSRMAGR